MPGKISDTYLAYQFIKRLVKPFTEWDAYKLGVIDETGKALKKRSMLTKEQLDSWGRFDVLVANLKRLMARLPNGQTKIASIAAAVLLLKEENIDENDVDLLQEKLEDEIVLAEQYVEEATYNFKFGKVDHPDDWMKPHKIVKWYDRGSRSHIVQVQDRHENEIETEYVGHRDRVKGTMEYLRRKHQLNEDAAINNVGGGNVAGVGVGPDGEPGKSQPGRKRKKGELPTTSLLKRK